MADKLTRKLLLQGVEELTAYDKELALVVRRYGPPPLWARKQGFATLVKIILEQQVSLISAKAMFKRLESAVLEVTPETMSELSVDGLRELGFTRQKAGYCEHLATLVLSGKLDLAGLNKMSDEKAYETLLSIKGIGPWTAKVYLLMALRRPDVWPDGDIALAESARKVKGLKERPDYQSLNKMAQKWKPWRSVAARILWHGYLSDKETLIR